MNGTQSWRRCAAVAALATSCLAISASAATSQTPQPQPEVQRVDLTVGRSYPIETTTAISRVSVANPDVADVAVVGERDVVINARAAGETDVLVWSAGAARRHYRVAVQSSAARNQVVLHVKFAEVRRDLLRELGVSALYRDPDGRVRAGSGIFRTDDVFTDDGKIQLPTEGGYLTVLTDFGTDDFLALIDAEASRGNARILAEPALMAANQEEAKFLAGGEIPVPVATPNAQGIPTVTVVFREFGVRLNFRPEIINDSLVKMRVSPEVSSLDYNNAILLSGFRIPALRSRKLETTVDVRRNTSLIISGLFNNEREQVKTGIPFLMDIPILGHLFSSTRWLEAESELVVIVTPSIVDPMRPRARDLVPVRPDTALPARDALERVLIPGAPRQGVPPAPAPAQQPPATRPPASQQQPAPQQPAPQQPAPQQQPASPPPARR